MMDIIRTNKLQAGDDTPVKLRDFNHSEFRKQFAVYLLGEIKDQIAFYHTNQEYEAFLNFFEFLHGKLHLNTTSIRACGKG